MLYKFADLKKELEELQHNPELSDDNHFALWIINEYLLIEEETEFSEIMTVSQVADYLEITARKVYKNVANGILPHYITKYNREIRFSKLAIAEWKVLIGMDFLL